MRGWLWCRAPSGRRARPGRRARGGPAGGAQRVEQQSLGPDELVVALGGPDLGQVRRGVGDGPRGLRGTALAQRGAGLFQVGVDGDGGLDRPCALRVEDPGDGPERLARLGVGGADRDPGRAEHHQRGGHREPSPERRERALGAVPAAGGRDDGDGLGRRLGPGLVGVRGAVGCGARGVGGDAQRMGRRGGGGGGRGGPRLRDPRGQHRDQLVLGAPLRGVRAQDAAGGELLHQRVVGPQRSNVDRPFGVAEQRLAVRGTHSLREIVLVSEPHPDLRSL
ncbi:hypothetical protein BJF78_01775 [Pseudonocardia sp. CNS-139]|nr:hypothetical protein BJF78_01775 [Pseudonocardia sp. CNS-139]